MCITLKVSPMYRAPMPLARTICLATSKYCPYEKVSLDGPRAHGLVCQGDGLLLKIGPYEIKRAVDRCAKRAGEEAAGKVAEDGASGPSPIALCTIGLVNDCA